MISHRIVLCFVLLTASVGLAQTSSDVPLADPSNAAQAPDSSPSDSELAQPPLVSDPTQPAASPQAPSSRAEPGEVPAASEPPPAPPVVPPGELIPHQYTPDSPDQLVPRVISEVFGGALGGVGMGIMGLLAGVSALEGLDCSDEHAGVCAATVLFVTVPAVFVGIPLGVMTAAESAGGRGKFAPALAGTLVGTGIGAIYGLTSEGTGPLVTGLIVGPLLGAIVGYEISNALEQRGPRVASNTPRVGPMVSATPHGGVLGGLSGSF